MMCASAVYLTLQVSGDKLLRINSQVGYWMAVSYRWFIVAAICFLLITVLLFTLTWKRKEKQVKDSKVGQREELSIPIQRVSTDTVLAVYCPKCGMERIENAKFCTKCGHRF